MEKKYRTMFKQQLKTHKSYYLPIIFLTLLLIMTLIAPLLPGDPNKTDVTNMLAAPSWQHLFGTDELGRDYFLRTLYGGRVSLLVGALAMLTSTVIGTVVGLTAGYFGGIIDNLLMRLVDILSSIPWMILIIVVSVLLNPGLQTIILVIGLFSWMSIARLVRAETLSAKEREYVTYAQFISEKPWKIIQKHVLPAVFPTLIVAATTSISNAIMTESSLSFLGVGIQQPMASWGSLLQNAQSNIQRAPYMAILPGLFILLTIFSFNKLGNLLSTIVTQKQTNGE